MRRLSAQLGPLVLARHRLAAERAVTHDRGYACETAEPLVRVDPARAVAAHLSPTLRASRHQLRDEGAYCVTPMTGKQMKQILKPAS